MKEVITIAIKEALSELGLPEADFAVEHPADFTHGDYAANVAMVLSKQVGKAPRVIAKQLLAVLEGQIEYVDRLEIAGPGFINFYLTRDFFTAELARINQAGESWGRNEDWAGKKVLVEYTSPNLFKPLHVGNLVGNIIGESFARLFTVSGATVMRCNYPSDIGLTVAKGVWGLKHIGGNPNDIISLGEAYREGNTAYEKEGSEAEEIKVINKALYEDSDPELSALRAAGIATSRASLGVLLKKLDTNFDIEITESEASGPGKEIVQANIGGVFVESEGAVVYLGEKVGLHTRVFLNSKGLPTYEAKDIGHFKLKTAAMPDWDCSVIVTGNEQTEYFKVVFAAIKELFPNVAERTLEHVPTGFLTLTTGKMSSRKGNVLTGESLLEEMEEAAKLKAAETRTDSLEELTEEIAVAALKYQILRQGPGSNIVFDKEKALSFEGDSGPYLQYTHARICSVLEKAKAAGLSANVELAPDYVYAVERLVYQFPEVVREAFVERAPHKITTYLTELAGAFNSFYAAEKIADENDEHASYKIALAEAVKTTLKNGLWILAIKTPGKM